MFESDLTDTISPEETQSAHVSKVGAYPKNFVELNGRINNSPTMSLSEFKPRTSRTSI